MIAILKTSNLESPFPVTDYGQPSLAVVNSQGFSI